MQQFSKSIISHLVLQLSGSRDYDTRPHVRLSGVCTSTKKMAQHQRPIDKEFEDADDTGVLALTGRNLRSFPVVAHDLVDYSEIIEAGKRKPMTVQHRFGYMIFVLLACLHTYIHYRFFQEQV